MKKLSFEKAGFLERHLLYESKAMAKYALDSGHKLPPALLQDLNRWDRQLISPPLEEGTEAGSGEPLVPTSASTAGNCAKELASIHGQLTKIVAPAKPGALLLLATEESQGGLKQYLGPVPLIRRMMFVAFMSLVSLVLVSLSPAVNGTPGSFSLLQSSGLKLFLNELFLLTAASIGASFYALFQANHYITQGTYDPKYESSYWIRFVLGVMAGTIMATLIPIDAGETAVAKELGMTLNGLEKPILAMIGGFSASVVYRILSRLVSAVESLVQGDTRDLLAARELEAKVRMEEQALQNRMQLAAKISKIQQQAQFSENGSDLQLKLAQVQKELITPDSYEEEKTPSRPSLQQA